MDYELIIDAHNDLRERCYRATRDYPDLLGDYSWLRYAISESDINLDYTAQGNILCYGHCFSMQTQDTEHFEFTIPFDVLEKS